MDGSKQRRAFAAAENALRLLAAGDRVRACESAAKAAQLDQVAIYADVEAAVCWAARLGGESEPMSREAWADVRAAVPAGPLQALVDSLSS